MLSEQLLDNSSESYNETLNRTHSITNHGSPIRAYYPIIGSAMLASVICLCLTIFIYAKLSEFKTVPGKILLSLAICLIANYCLLFLDLLFSKSLPFQVCRIIAISIHAIFVANFFWTNVMAFDIWRTVTSKSPAQGQHVKFWKYSLFAWLGAVIVALPAIIVDIGDLLPKGYAPAFGTERCWFSGSLPILVFFTGPVALVVIINLILFIMTAKTIRHVENTTSMQVKISRQRFHLYLKLFLVNGLIWATEFIPTITRIYQLFALAGLLTSLQGVFLFIIFVCKRRIWRRIKDRWFAKDSPSMVGNLGHKQSIASASSRITLSTSMSNLSQHRL